MKNFLSVIPVSLLAVFLLNFGCKNDDLLATPEKSETTNEEKKNNYIEGNWVIDSLNLSSIIIPSFCYQIEEGAIFEFTEKDSLKIYPNEASEPCETFLYSIKDNLIQLVKDDMVMLGTVQLITNDRLKINSKTFFRWQKEVVPDSITRQTLVKEGVTVFLNKM